MPRLTKANTPRLMRSKSGKIVDIIWVIEPDLTKGLKLFNYKFLLRDYYKGISKSLLVCQKEAQKNITRMKAVLSGWMRNNWGRIISATKDTDTGSLWNDAWYAYLVHQGLKIHASPPEGGFISSKGLTPDNIASIQRQRLKMKRASVKGPRPFLFKALKDKSDEMVVEVGIGLNKSLFKSFKSAGKRILKSGGSLPV